MSEASVGKVYLVGAGPGDPGLISVRGLECLRRADLVLYDGLVNPLLLRHTPAHVARTCRVNGPGGRRLDQDEINEQLVAEARAGRTVVRLKGGDPFVFGRGSEEAAALRAAGIPFEVVPGVTAATAASAYAGISLTHRRMASAVALVTGHEDPEKPGSSLDYRALAAFPGTLVFYMGLHRLPAIASALVAAGKDTATPAAVVSRGTLPAQREVVATLGTIAEQVAAAELHAPSLIIVGDCVSQAAQLDWFEHRPLLGTRIGLTRPEGQLDDLIARCYELGAEPVPMPTIRIGPPADLAVVDALLDEMAAGRRFDWVVFTSANGVHGLLGRMWDRGGDVRQLGAARIATIGPATADVLGEYRLRADLVPEMFRAEALAEALAPHVAGRSVLWARANRGRDVLPDRLAAAGAELTQLTVYDNEDVDHFEPEIAARVAAGELDWIGVSSPSIARNLARLLPEDACVKLASISPVTTAAAKESGLTIAAEATDYTWEGILEAIVAKCTETPKGSE